LLLVPVGAQNAFAHGQVDQSYVRPFTFESFISLTSGPQPKGQEFVPSVDNIIGVDLTFAKGGVSISDVTINLREGTITNPVLGTKTKTVDVTGGEVTEHFDFDSTIPLTPGNTYVIEFSATNNIAILGENDGTIDGFPSGSSIFGINLVQTFDFSFQTYFFIPIGGELLPIDTTALLLSGVQTNAAWLIPVIVSVIGIGIVIARKF